MNLRKKLKKERGITLIALVITIIVLIILAVVTINITFGDNGLFYTAKEARRYQLNAEAYDNEWSREIAEQIQEKVNEINTLSAEKIAAVNNKVKENTGTLQKVVYVPKTVAKTVTVEGAYNGGLDDQVFSQSDLLEDATTGESIKWFVLYADENGVNLVSETTKAKVSFKDSAGYDNCLYYLNELSKLFANEDYGITEARVHALRLTDIKKAAEIANAGYKVTDNNVERDWNWDLDVVKTGNISTYNNGNVGQKTKTYTNTSYTYYPGLYTANANKEVTANNPMYDELPGSKITTDSGITRNLGDGSNPASKLTVNYTCFDMHEHSELQEKLGKLAESNIGEELFNSSENNIYWFASRCIVLKDERIELRINKVSSGNINSKYLCHSNGTIDEYDAAFRVVISVPSSHVNIANDGTVTLK